MNMQKKSRRAEEPVIHAQCQMPKLLKGYLDTISKIPSRDSLNALLLLMLMLVVNCYC
jgi:hypothetical protein